MQQSTQAHAAQIHLNSIMEQMSPMEKYLRIAPYLKCSEPVQGPNHETHTTCSCTGWRTAEQLSSPTTMFLSSIGVKAKDDSCATCKHRPEAHGGLLKLKPEEVDRIASIVIQIEQHQQEAQRNVDPAKRQKHMEIVNQFKLAIQSPYVIQMRNVQQQQQLKPKAQGMYLPQGNGSTSSAPSITVEPKFAPNPKPEQAKAGSGTLKKESTTIDLLGNPPFEKPVITQILKNFIEYKFSRANEARQKIAEKIWRVFLAGINRHELAPPSLPSSAYDISVNDRIYQLNYKRWRHFCKGTKKASQFKLADIFGRTVLRSILRQVQEGLSKTQAFGDAELYVNEFFREFEKELNNELSIILLEDFGQHFKALKEQPGPAKGDPNQERKRKQQQPTPEVGTTATKKRKPDPSSASSGQMAASISYPVANIPMGPLDQPNGPPEGSEEGTFAIPTTETHTLLGPETGMETKARDEKARQEERKGLLTSRVITNDRDPQHMIWLIHLKNIFSKQLPKMPKDYIVRLVLDRNHRSLVLLKNTQVVGGICFRPFHTQGFLEIAFCAIISSEQVKGYGTHLMNHLKHHAQAMKIYNFLTYADNYAIGYFKKQGFTKQITLDRKQWLGFIKDYDGGTLMECVIHKRVNYLKVPDMVGMQRKAIYDKIKEISFSHIKHKGIEHSRTELGILDISEIPGIKESGWKPRKFTRDDLLAIQAQCREVLTALKEHGSSWPFHHPVNREEVPDYYEIIKDPMDLETMEKRLHQGNYYITKDIFLADLKRICDNCRIYNREDTEYYKCANEIENEFVNKRQKWFPRPDMQLQAPPALE